MTNYKNYSAFSNEGWIPDLENRHYDSLESIHDTMHGILGQEGHMAFIPFSSYDPVFWLHHAMVDRIFAMWQLLYPNEWVVPTVCRQSTFTISVGQIVDSKTPLTPFFFDANGTFWDSDMVRDPAVLNYAYKETVNKTFSVGKDSRAAQTSVRGAINHLYGNASPASLMFPGDEQRVAEAPSPKSVPKHNHSRVDTRIKLPGVVSKIIIDNRYREWIINLHLDRQCLNGTFFIHFFFGEPPKDPKQWGFAPNLVGTISAFASPAVMIRPGMQSMRISTTMPLTTSLMKKIASGELSGLDSAAAERYLRDELRYAIIRADGKPAKRSEVPSLVMELTSAVVEAPASEDSFPLWHDPEIHLEI